MALKLADAPAAGHGIVERTLQAQAGPAGGEALRGFVAGPGRTETAAPHPVWVAGLDDAAAGRVVAGAQPQGWRYLVLANGAANMTAFVPQGALEAEDTQPETGFAQIGAGPMGQQIVDAIERAEGLSVGGSEDLEVRTLEVPGLSFVALWLHGAEDVFIPLPPLTYGLAEGVPVSADDLAKALQAPAAKRAAQAPGLA